MHRFPILAALLLMMPIPTGAQQPSFPTGGGFLEWMGLEPGDTQVVELGGEQLCVTVEEPRTIRGRTWAELRGLRWPGLASDSRVLVPLDGSIGLSVIATPGPRPNPRDLVSPLDTLRGAFPGSTDLDRLTGSRSPIEILADGWHAVGPGEDPSALVYTWCSTCSDAGTRVVFEKGRGIRSVTRTTIVGTETLRRVDGSMCAERPEAGVEFEVYVLPEDERRP